MAKNIVIVESPAKANTIEKFLGEDFLVTSSYGHIRDLKKKDKGIDIANNFSPHYIIPEEKKALVKELKKLTDKSETVWLATDEDREGEAIAWHLKEVLELPEEKIFKVEMLEGFTFSHPKSSFNRAKCSICGEYVFERYLRVANGKQACIPCAEKVSGPGV